MPPPVVPASALPAAAPGDVAPASCPLLGGADGESTSAQAPLVKAQLATAEGAPPVVTLPPIIIEGEALTDIAPAETETLDPSDPAAAQAALASLQDARRVIDNGGKLSPQRSEEHTSELQSLMRISYAVFCLKKKNTLEIQPQHHV